MESAKKRMPETDFTIPLLQLVRSLLEEIQPGTTPQIINLDSYLEKDLGLDSLVRVELWARIERHFDLLLPERVFAEAETPRDLLRELAKASTHKAPAKPVIITPPKTANDIMLPAQAQTLVDALEWHVTAHSARAHI